MLLALSTATWAEQCYFQTRRTSYDSGTQVKKVSCQKLYDAIADVRFVNGRDNYAPYFAKTFGREGNLIMEDNGEITMSKFYYALGQYRFYGGIMYRGGNAVACRTTTSTGVCDRVEYTEFGNYLRDFFYSPARKKNRRK